MRENIFIVLFEIIYILFYLYEYFACRYICISGASQRLETGVKSHGTRVDNYESPFGFWQLNPGLLQLLLADETLGPFPSLNFNEINV